MPVPVTPEKKALPETVTAEPKPPCSVATSDPIVLAGYRACLKEAIRFLLQEESVSEDHPVIAGLVGLNNDTVRLDSHRISGQLAHELRQAPGGTSSEDQCPKEPQEPASQDSLYKAGYEVVLKAAKEDETDSEMEMETESDSGVEAEDSDEEDDKDICANPVLRSKLIRLFYQGCDLVASPFSEIDLKRPPLS